MPRRVIWTSRYLSIGRNQDRTQSSTDETISDYDLKEEQNRIHNNIVNQYFKGASTPQLHIDSKERNVSQVMERVR